MSEILHTNIFFLITSIAVVLLSLLACLILWQVYRLVTALRRIVDQIEAAGEQVAADVAQARQFMYHGGLIARVLRFFTPPN